MTASSSRRRSVVWVSAYAVLAPLLTVLAIVLPTAAARAETAYQYWGFAHLDGAKWTASMKGADQWVPKDGSVEGLRFAINSGPAMRMPRAVMTFDQICGTTPAADGVKRVGIVVDYGREADATDGSTPPAPTAFCATGAANATESALLASVVKVRTSKGMVCAVSDYPATGCADAVPSVSAAAKAADTALAEPITVAAGTAPSGSATSSSSVGSGTPTAESVSASSAASGSASTAATTQAASNSPALWIVAVLVAAAFAVAAWLTLARRRRESTGARH